MVVGVGRSGTTLLRLMLDAHPDLAIPPETHFIPRLTPLAHLSDARATFLRGIARSERWPDFGLDIEDLRQALERNGPLNVSDCVRGFFELYAAKFGKPRWGDKTPIYLWHMNAIQALLPESAFIHIIRDGRDVALSTQSVWFGKDRALADLAQRWVGGIATARRQAAALPRYLEIKYEDLVANPEAVLREVCAFIDLDFEPEMLTYTRTSAERLDALQPMRDAQGRVAVSAEHRRDIHSMTLKPPDPTRAARWRTEMSAADQAEYEAVAGAMLDALGYETGKNPGRD